MAERGGYVDVDEQVGKELLTSETTLCLAVLLAAAFAEVVFMCDDYCGARA